MKVLVTGGAGYIGSHTVVELQKHDYEVVIVDSLSNSYEYVIDSIAEITGIRPVFEKFDLCEFDKTRDFFSRNRDIKAIVHFAAFKAVGESVEKPLLYYHNNLVSMVNLLQCMKEFAINIMVFSSSCTVYGQPDRLPVTEDSPIKEAWSPYGYTKQISEKILADTIKTSELKGISLRYFNPIGAHESAKIGELPIGIPNNLVPYITQTAIGKRPFLRVFGNDYNTPDGTPIRDYIHVVDLAQAHVVAVDRFVEKEQQKDYEIFNLGTGTGHSVFEVVNSFEKVSGSKINYRILDRRPGDVEKVWADTSLANKVLGWKAKRGLDEMMLSAWKWELAMRDKGH